MKRKLSALALAVSLGAFSAPAFAAGDLESQGTVILAKAHDDAMLLWDITPAVAPLVAQPTSVQAKLIAIEIGAEKILLARLDDVPEASSVTVRVIYQKTGEVCGHRLPAGLLGQNVLKLLQRDARPRGCRGWGGTAGPSVSVDMGLLLGQSADARHTSGPTSAAPARPL